MEFSSIIEVVLAAGIVTIGYFLKVVHSDVRQNTKEVGENKGKLDNLSTRIDHESEMRNTTLNNIMSILSEIKEDVKNIKR